MTGHHEIAGRKPPDKDAKAPRTNGEAEGNSGVMESTCVHEI